MRLLIIFVFFCYFVYCSECREAPELPTTGLSKADALNTCFSPEKIYMGEGKKKQEYFGCKYKKIDPFRPKTNGLKEGQCVTVHPGKKPAQTTYDCLGTN